MTRVCLIGTADCNLQYELLSRETSRDALSTYDLERPFENSIALRTVSIGAAVSLLNDLNWYLTRFVDAAFVQEPSVSDDEWVSRSLATELRNGSIDPPETDEYCAVYGLDPVGPSQDTTADDPTDASDTAADHGAEHEDEAEHEDDEDGAVSSESARSGGPQWRLVEPLYVRRTDGDLPAYDLRDVEETLVVRLTADEYTP